MSIEANIYLHATMKALDDGGVFKNATASENS